MPVVLLEIDARDASSAALGAVKAQLGQLEGIMRQVSGTATATSESIAKVGVAATDASARAYRFTTALGAIDRELLIASGAVDRYLAGLARVNAAYSTVVGGTTRADTALTGLATGFGKLGTAAGLSADAMTAQGNAVGAMSGKYDALSTALTGPVGSFDAQAAAAGRARIAIDAEIVSMGKLAAIKIPSVVTGGGGAPVPAGGGGGPTPFMLAQPAKKAVTAEEQKLIDMKGVTGLAKGELTATSLLGSGFMSGPGLVGLAGIGIGFESIKKNMELQSAAATLAAQVGANQSTPLGRTRQEAVNAALEGATQYALSGKSPMPDVTMLASMAPLIRGGYAPSVIQSAVQPLTNLAATTGQTDLAGSAAEVNSYLNLLGKGAKSTTTDLKQAMDSIQKAGTLGNLTPQNLSMAMPRLFSAIQGTGISPDTALAMLEKASIVNPKITTDTRGISTLITDLLVSPSTTAQKAAAQMHLAIGPGALSSYGGSLPAMLQAYQTATAGPKQAQLLAELFGKAPSTGFGAATSFGYLTSGGGTQQLVGLQAQQAANTGAGQQAYSAYSQGINQQGAMLANQLSANFADLGGTLNDKVTPALLHMASAALLAFDSFLKHPMDEVVGGVNKLKYEAQSLLPGAHFMDQSWVDKMSAHDTFVKSDTTPHKKGDKVNMQGFWGNFDSSGNFIIDPNQGNIGPTGQGVKNPNAANKGPWPGWMEDANTSLLNFYSNVGSGIKNHLPTFGIGWETGGSAPPRGGTPATRTSFGPLGFNPLPSNLASALAAAGNAPSGWGANEQAQRRAAQVAAHPSMPSWMQEDTRGSIAIYRDVMAGQAAALAIDVKVNKTLLDQPVRDMRGALTALTTQGGPYAGTKAQVDQALVNLKGDLAKSAYSTGQQQGIYSQEARKATLYEQTLNAPADQAAVSAAQTNLDAARQMNETPDQIKAVFDQWVAAQRTLIIDSTALSMKDRAKQLGALGVTAEVGGYTQQLGNANNAIKDLANAAQIALLQGNQTAFIKARTAEVGMQGADANLLKLRPSDVALLKAQLQVDIMGAFPRINTTPFFQSNAGLSGFQAGPESTAVRMGGAGEDPLVAENKRLRAEVAKDNNEIIRLLAIIASRGGSPNVASGPPPGRG